ncbi:hypothetical protein PIB30_060695 [Stylosanthes scabra]|uniref:Uncharacterized protein n=1 Tax=Stylosanthes scabra TaxID=79078 RepID=A0ABU6TKE3_9FABA|nr:hypothetical protein [Stylosanthes scabra]
MREFQDLKSNGGAMLSLMDYKQRVGAQESILSLGHFKGSMRSNKKSTATPPTTSSYSTPAMSLPYRRCNHHPQQRRVSSVPSLHTVILCSSVTPSTSSQRRQPLPSVLATSRLNHPSCRRASSAPSSVPPRHLQQSLFPLLTILKKQHNLEPLFHLFMQQAFLPYSPFLNFN